MNPRVHGLGLLLLLLAARTATAGDLSAAEVACDSLRLSGLLERSAVSAPHSTKPSQLVLSFTASGDFAGQATGGGAGGSADAALAFSTNPEETTLLRNPARPQLFSVSLTRNDLNSDRVAPGDAHELRLTVNPTLDLGNPPSGNLLALDNLLSGGKSTDAKPGRGLGSLIAPCHDDFSARDVHVFRVLSRIARVEVAEARSIELAIYRGASVDTYRFDAYVSDAGGGSLGRLSGALSIPSSPSGDLGAASMEVFPPCQVGTATDCTSLSGDGAIALFKPVISGLPPPTPYRVSTAGPRQVDVDFADLLAGTSWRQPL
ncbi:MAG TPA: hypothetical protein VN851_03030 [Thermoanaerobaculia bacterium]|nr:hypothetical protein [Thermoanaerobaculia bacterium]